MALFSAEELLKEAYRILEVVENSTTQISKYGNVSSAKQIVESALGSREYSKIDHLIEFQTSLDYIQASSRKWDDISYFSNSQDSP